MRHTNGFSPALTALRRAVRSLAMTVRFDGSDVANAARAELETELSRAAAKEDASEQSGFRAGKGGPQ
jgi:hypothetical protein